MSFIYTQVVVLSEGYQLYSGEAEGAQPWFTNRLGYPYNAQLDGAVSDWLMDLVSIGFAKSEAHHRRCVCVCVCACAQVLGASMEAGKGSEEGSGCFDSPLSASQWMWTAFAFEQPMLTYLCEYKIQS